MSFETRLQDICDKLTLMLQDVKKIYAKNINSIATQIGKVVIGDVFRNYISNASNYAISQEYLQNINVLNDSAFYCCTGLTSINIPDNITRIGSEVFTLCTSLTDVNIGNSVTSIGYDAFSGCSSLASVIIPDSVTSIGGSAFRGCSSLASVIIPDSVTSIGYYAFSGCSSLASVIIPDSVTSIGYDAFQNCTSLTDVYLNPATPPTLESKNGIPSATTTIHVPVGSGNAYKTATNWSRYADKIVEDIVIETATE